MKNKSAVIKDLKEGLKSKKVTREEKSRISEPTIKEEIVLDKEKASDAIKQFESYTKNASEEDIDKVNDKLGGMKKGPLKKIWDNVIALWDMINDNEAAWGSKAIALGALIYTVSPIDAIPDIIPILGLTDDAAVIAAAVASLGAALNKYKKDSL